VLYTGSHNLTGPSLRSHDESMLRIERPEIVSAYQTNFETLWDLAGQ
jgi:phosphatidylserine/phosphatidylglycerophosphate/cardiolipin synthase-like enzyme